MSLPYPPRYPPARKADVTDDYHGVCVADPYRWLENADAPETEGWVRAENALTRSTLDGPLRDAVVFANAAAALSVTRLGAQPSIPRRKEIDAFLSSRGAMG